MCKHVPYIHSIFSITSGTTEFDMYFSELCNMKLHKVMKVSLLSFDICDLAKIKHDNMNQMIGLKDIFVLIM